MVKIDENHEAIACICMAIESDKEARVLKVHRQAGSDFVKDHGSMSEIHSQVTNEQHWTFGSPSGAQQESRELEKTISPTDHNYNSFDDRLHSFITHSFPEDAPHYEDLIYVCPTQTHSHHPSYKITGSILQVCHGHISIYGRLDID